jgi:hypothetical protein
MMLLVAGQQLVVTTVKVIGALSTTAVKQAMFAPGMGTPFLNHWYSTG